MDYGLVSLSLELLCRLTLGTVFLFAGAEKLLLPATFREALAASRLGSSARESLARLLPLVELGLGAMLVLGGFISAAAGAASFLLLAFAAAALLSKSSFSGCGCLSLLPARGRTSLVLRDVGLVLLTVPLLPYLVLPPAAAVGFVVLSASFVGLAATFGGQFAEAHQPRHMDHSTSSRRQFLARLLGTSLLSAFVIRLPLVSTAEAACYGCRSCAPEMISYGCYDGCCLYLVRDRDYCAPSCVSCSGWYYQEACGCC